MEKIHVTKRNHRTMGRFPLETPEKSETKERKRTQFRNRLCAHYCPHGAPAPHFKHIAGQQHALRSWCHQPPTPVLSAIT